MPWSAPPRWPAPTRCSAASATWCTTTVHHAADHQRVSQCAPCSCPEPGCAFVGSRAMLLGHFAAGHQRPTVTVCYGRPWNLGFSLSHCWQVLVGDEDRSVFLVSLGLLGVATAVSLLCVRPDGEAEAAPQFRCKLSLERPAGDGKDNLVPVASAASSSALSTGALAPGQGMFLAVPQELLSGDTNQVSDESGKSKQIRMIVCPAVGIQYSGFWDVGWSSYDGEEPCDDLDAYYRYHQHQVRKGSQHPTGGAPDHRRRKRRRAIHSIVLSPRVATYVHCPQVVSTSMSSTSPRQVEAAPSMFTPLSSFASRIRHPHVGSVGADGITMTHANALVV